MKKIVMFDTSYSTLNLGDFIINESINNEMKYLLKDSFVARFSTHTALNHFYQSFHHNYIVDVCNQSNYKFLCGTNIFTKNLLHIMPNFNITLFDIKKYKGCIAIGCGCGNEKKCNKYTKFIYKKILSKKYIHSARDEKTKKFLEDLGLKAINTGCATLWSLTKEHCKKIPTKKSNRVVFTLTDYVRDQKNDQLLIDILKRNYKKVYFWIQGIDDLDYIYLLSNIDNIEYINPNIESYRELLKNGDIDYVGTRLHAGIFAMQNNIRTIIIEVDNRTKDMKETYDLIAIDRNNISYELEKMINCDFETKIKINEKAINEWKNQFNK